MIHRQSAIKPCRSLIGRFGRRSSRELLRVSPQIRRKNHTRTFASLVSLNDRKRPRRGYPQGSCIRWIETSAASTTDIGSINSGAGATLIDRFDRDLLTIVPEMLDFFDATVIRRWKENMDFERRIQRHQQKHHCVDYDTLTSMTAPRALGDIHVARGQKESGQSNRELSPDIPANKPPATGSASSPSGLDVLARSTEEPDVIQVEEHMAKIHQEAMLGEGFTKALVLLRTLQEDQWVEFDNPEMSDVEQEPSEETSSAETAVGNSSNEVDTESCAPFMEMVEQVRTRNQVTLETKELNTFLARLALSPELLPDEILSAMMKTYLKMNGADKAASQPNAITFEILLLSFCRRFSALPTANDFVHQLRQRKAWNPKTLEAAAMLCEKRVDHDLALKLLDDVDGLKEIPGKRFFRSLINVAKADDNRNTALRVLQVALKNPEGTTDLSLDKLFVNAIHWRTKNKHGKALDNSDYIDAILRMLESNVSIYAPGFTVWRELIMMGSNGAKRNPGRYRLVDRAFSRLELYIPRYYPDFKLIKHGLDTSRTLRKPALAASVILHAIEHVDRSPLSSSDKPAVDVSPVPGNEILKAMETCVQWNDAFSCGKILAAAESINLPEPLLKPIYFLGVLGYARRGNSEETERILFDMQQRGMVLEDKFYGALMLCYAMSKQIEQAQYLMRSIESGDLGVAVGPAVYDGYVLACVMCQDWDDVVAVFQRMKSTALHPPSASSCHGILLAGYRQGRTADESKALLDDLLAAGAQFNREVALLSIKILLPDLCRGGKTVPTIRSKLRSNLPKDEVVKGAIVQLIRSLRIAEMEEERGLPSTSLMKVGSETWTAVMKDVLHVMDVEKRKSNGPENIDIRILH